MAEEEPLVSVIMPVYNAGDFLKDAIDSILTQSYTNFEFLIFNDGSVDNSLEIIQSYNDSRINIAYNGQNKGYVEHLNNGIVIAKGKYIARMDSDDIAEPNRLEKQVIFMETNNDYVICGSYANIFGNKKSHLILPSDNKSIKLFLLYNTAFCHPSVLIRKKSLIDNNLFYSKELMPAEDSDLWTRLAFFGKMYNIPEFLLNYRVHSENISYKKRSPELLNRIKESKKRYIKKIFGSVLQNDIEIEYLYVLFFPNSIQITLEYLENISSVVNIFKNSSYINNEFSKEELLLLLYEKFAYLCTCSTSYGFKVFSIYYLTVGNQKSFIFTVKVFLKSLIRFNSLKKIL